MVTQVYHSETRKLNRDFQLSLERGKNDDPYSSKSNKRSVKLFFNIYKNYTKLTKNEMRRISAIKRTKDTSSFYIPLKSMGVVLAKKASFTKIIEK